MIRVHFVPAIVISRTIVLETSHVDVRSSVNQETTTTGVSVPPKDVITISSKEVSLKGIIQLVLREHEDINQVIFKDITNFVELCFDTICESSVEMLVPNMLIITLHDILLALTIAYPILLNQLFSLLSLP